MADEPSRRISETVRLWLAAVAVPIVLAVAGFWQFYLKEVWWPATAVNLTTDVSVKEAGLSAATAAAAGNLEAIEVVITARNPSSSTVYLCSNYWAAWGIAVSAPKPGSDKSEDWLKGMTDIFNERSQRVVGKHYRYSQATLVSVGGAFKDTQLRANEKISATRVFYVPQGLYDFLHIDVMLPTTSRENPTRQGEPALEVQYRLNSNRFDIDVESVYRVNADGTRETLPRDTEGNFRETYYGLQRAYSTVQLSLWQSKSSPPTTTEPPDASSPRKR